MASPYTFDAYTRERAQSAPITPALRNAVARALITDVTLNGPCWPSMRKARQTMLTQAVARSLGKPFADVRRAVVETWPKVYGQEYLFAGEN